MVFFTDANLVVGICGNVRVVVWRKNRRSFSDALAGSVGRFNIYGGDRFLPDAPTNGSKLRWRDQCTAVAFLVGTHLVGMHVADC